MLSLLQRTSEARAQFQAVLNSDPANRDAINGLASLTSGAQVRASNRRGSRLLQLHRKCASRNRDSDARTGIERWTTAFGVSPYHLFGENAVKIWADAAYRFHENNWVRVLGAGANPQDVVPESEALIEYGHGFRFSNP